MYPAHNANFDVAIIGGGPAGLAAALAANREGRAVLLVEREVQLGGILKQCIHDGFGLLRFGEKLSGPEYAERFISALEETNVCVLTSAFVTRLTRSENGFSLTLSTRGGMRSMYASALVLATGCRERTSRQIGIHGRHCAGVLTAGTAQNYVNLLGQMPTKRCVILGSGDIGLIMARRLTLEGARVLGVYEAKPTPSGLSRNIVQCLDDFGIPLHTSKTVTRVFGEERLQAVEICSVDASMRPIDATQERIACDALILSVGLIPENELATSLGIPLDPKTKGPIVDEHAQTLLPGVFSCGNSLFVNDLVDYVSQSGEIAGRNAALYAASPVRHMRVTSGAEILSLSPQCIRIGEAEQTRSFFLRAAREMENATLTCRIGEQIVFAKRFLHLRPPEMELIEIELDPALLSENATLDFSVSEDRA